MSVLIDLALIATLLIVVRAAQEGFAPGLPSLRDTESTTPAPESVADRRGSEAILAESEQAIARLPQAERAALPPSPDPTINAANLAGVDSNRDGVRDDVERVIHARTSGMPAAAREAARAYAAAVSTALMAADGRRGGEAVKAMSGALTGAVCYLQARAPAESGLGPLVDSSDGDAADAEIDHITDVILDTDTRRRALKSAEDLAAGAALMLGECPSAAGGAP